jgi:hypothetical protein
MVSLSIMTELIIEKVSINFGTKLIPSKIIFYSIT